MSAAAKILGPNGRPYRAAAPRAMQVVRVRARYDAAQTTPENTRYYSAADALSALAANSPDVRQRLRMRARYERSNNSYLEGIVQTIADDTIGTGPRLQLLSGKAEANQPIEQAFGEWADAVNLAEKLRTMRMARIIDGEAFALLISNPGLPTQAQLDVQLVEADRVTTPTVVVPSQDAVDGIVFDDWGNPKQYHVLRDHPGDLMSFGAAFGEYDVVPSRLMLHWFRRDRPEQVRGVPEITSALLDFGELRRYSKAVLAAAETAADFAAVLESDAPADDNDRLEGEPFETLEIEKRMLTTLPGGHKLNQLKAEHPTTTHAEFERTTLTRIIRCLGIPINIALGDSSKHNYSSARLDHQAYFRSLLIEQDRCRRTLLDPLLRAWLDEMSRVSDLLPDGPDRLGGWPHRWIWDAPEYVDPLVEAQGQEVRLRTLMTTFTDECYRQGKDPDTVAEQIAVDRARFERLKIPIPVAWGLAAPPPAAQPQSQPDGGNNGDQQDG